MRAAGYRGRAFLYVLVASGPEDLLKVGMTHDPLSRWAAFHPRWFEAFDLERSLLVETEMRADARALETGLHRRLRQHRCPLPLSMRLAAGGATEWYRGAGATARDFVDRCATDGFVLHTQARTLLSQAMADGLGRLDGIVREAHARQLDGWLGAEELRAVRDLVDAHRAFGADIDGMFAHGLRAALLLA